MPVKRQRSTAQVRIAHTCEGSAMYVKEEFVYGERRNWRGVKICRTRLWTVLVLSDDDEDSESEDELSSRVEARGGERRSKSIVPALVIEAESRWVLVGAVLLPCGKRLRLGHACEGPPREANGLTELESQVGLA